MDVQSQESGGASTAILGATRRTEIANLVNEQGEASVAELAERFAVSNYTVRRDLDTLNEAGLVVRTHGGAVSATAPVRPDSDFELRLRMHAQRKEEIGKLASTLVDDNTSCFINSGTTALALVRNLRERRDLTIVTNNLRLPTVIDPRVFRDLHMLGGEVRMVSQATVGPVILRSPIEGDGIRVRCDSAYIAVGAVDPIRGFTTSSMAEASVMRSIASCADRVVILADATKVGHSLFASIGPLAMADIFVTDSRPSNDVITALEGAGVQLMVAEDQQAGS